MTTKSLGLGSFSLFGILGVLGVSACGQAADAVTPPCSKPEGVLEPTTITIRAGESATFTIPGNVDMQGRTLQWVVTPVGVVAKNTNPSDRSISALGVAPGRAMVTVTDLSSARTCRDVWGAALLVE